MQSYPAENRKYHKIFLIGTLLKSAFVIVEIYYGLLSNSTALISDALHNASDSLGLFIAWGGYLALSIKPFSKFTFGLKNTTILAAFINAVLVFVSVGGICWEAILRFEDPEVVNNTIVIIVALLSMLMNGFIALLFLSGKKDVNIWGAFLHIISDAVVALGVIIGSVLVILTAWRWVDPVVSLLISLLIVISSWGLFKESMRLMLHAVPAHINLKEVNQFLLERPNVLAIHDLHVWALSSSETALSVHIVIADPSQQMKFIKEVTDKLLSQFNIAHTTIQVENQTLLDCQIACEK